MFGHFHAGLCAMRYLVQILEKWLNLSYNKQKADFRSENPLETAGLRL
jgi:hypothetical protein